MRRIYASPRKSFSTFAFTLSSILISGGQGRLKPSPGNFFVASTPSLLPMAISLAFAKPKLESADRFHRLRPSEGWPSPSRSSKAQTVFTGYGPAKAGGVVEHVGPKA